MHLHDEIAKVPFELYKKSERVDGRDLENWLEAEKIVKTRYDKTDPASIVKKAEGSDEEAVQKATKVKKEAKQAKNTKTKKIKGKDKPK